jgi:hypothetical protein
MTVDFAILVVAPPFIRSLFPGSSLNIQYVMVKTASPAKERERPHLSRRTIRRAEAPVRRFDYQTYMGQPGQHGSHHQIADLSFISNFINRLTMSTGSTARTSPNPAIS